jgi:hypothetical protein
MDVLLCDIETREVRVVEVPEIPAEILETIGTAPRRLAASQIPRVPVDIGRPRASVQPRAWVMGGSVD